MKHALGLIVSSIWCVQMCSQAKQIRETYWWYSCLHHSVHIVPDCTALQMCPPVNSTLSYSCRAKEHKIPKLLISERAASHELLPKMGTDTISANIMDTVRFIFDGLWLQTFNDIRLSESWITGLWFEMCCLQLTMHLTPKEKRRQGLMFLFCHTLIIHQMPYSCTKPFFTSEALKDS